MRTCQECREELKPGCTRTKCDTCRKRHYRKLNPVRAAWKQLRDNARRRNKTFTITWEQWQTWYTQHHVGELRGRHAGKWSIDRIDNSKGYSLDNIQLVPMEWNSMKGTK